MMAIENSKTDKSTESVIFSSNSITVMNTTGFSFSGLDLSRVNIRGANIRNGIFQYTNFSFADLTKVNLTNCNLESTIFVETIMTDVTLEILPDLRGHNDKVRCLNYSHDGKYIASGSNDHSIKIW